MSKPANNHQKLGSAKEGPTPKASEGAEPCQHLSVQTLLSEL